MADKADLWPDYKQPDVNNVGQAPDRERSCQDEVNSDGSSEFQWGADWKDCNENQFAVVRQKFPDDSIGISVYKVVRMFSGHDETMIDRMEFEGVEYICHIVNTQIECVQQGRWNYNNTLSKRNRQMNWSVVVYFDTLTVQRGIPAAACKVILQHHRQHPLFD